MTNGSQTMDSSQSWKSPATLRSRHSVYPKDRDWFCCCLLSIAFLLDLAVNSEETNKVIMDSGVEMVSKMDPEAEFPSVDKEDLVDEDVVIHGREPFAYRDSQARRQNRCFLLVAGSLALVLVVYVVGGMYSSEETALDGEVFDAKQGVVVDGFDGSKSQQQYEEALKDRPSTGAHDWWTSHGKDNPFGNQNIDVNEEYTNEARWNETHPGEPFPGKKPTGSGALGHKGTGGKDVNFDNDNPEEADGPKTAGTATVNVCDHSAYADWLNARVTIGDGNKYEIVERLKHDHKAFVQGLTYADGTLWESNGLYGRSTVRILDPATADVMKSIDMNSQLFGEGMAYRDGLLYQITWKSKRGFIYDAETLDLVREFAYKTTLGEGWGITWDPCDDEFIVTDGSPYLHFWDVDTLEQTRVISVKRMNGDPAEELNEIEWFRGKILANVWYEDVLLVINPVTGDVEKEYDFSDLFPKNERKKLRCDVFNGISVSEDPDILYVTGKKWDRMFKVRLLA